MAKEALHQVLPTADVIIAIDRATHLANPGSILIQATRTDAEHAFAVQVEDYCDQHIWSNLYGSITNASSVMAYIHVFKAIDYMLDHSLTVAREMIKRRHWFLDRKSARCSLFKDVDAAVAEENRDGRLQQLLSYGGAYWEYEDFDHSLLGASTARTIKQLKKDIARLTDLLEVGQFLEEEPATSEYRMAGMLKDWIEANDYDTITVFRSSQQTIALVQSSWKLYFEREFGELLFVAEENVHF